MSDADYPEKPSKSAKKRAMHALQALGEELVALTDADLARLEMPEALRTAVLDARRFRSREARRRQLQYIGRLMREVEVEPLQAALADVRGASAAAIARHHAIERWRERLLADESVLGEIARAYPMADLVRLRQLRRNVMKERAAGKPPRAFRELFRALKELVDV